MEREDFLGKYFCKLIVIIFGILVVLFISCQDPNSPEYTNPHDYHSSLYIPNKPTQFTVGGLLRDDSRVFTWKDNSFYESGYRIERRLYSSSTYQIVCELSPNSTVYYDTTSVLTDTIYYYRVSSVSSHNTSSLPESIAVFTRFFPPSDLCMTCFSETSIKLEWKDSCAFEVGFIIEKSINKQIYSELITLPANSTSYIVEDLDPQFTYYFRIRAFTKYNFSKYSNTLSISRTTAPSQFLYSRSFSRSYTFVRSVSFSPDGRILACSGEHNVDIFRVADGILLASLPHRYNYPVYSVKFSPDGKYLADGHGGTIWIWNMSDFSKKTEFGYIANEVFSVSWSPGGDTIAAVTSSGNVQLWRVSTATYLRSYGSFIWNNPSAAISPDGKILALGDSLILLRISDGSLIHTFSTSKFLFSIVFHPSGDFVACIVGNDYRLQIWDVSSGTLRIEMQETYSIRELAFSKNGTRIAAAGRNDGTFNIWDTQTGMVLLTIQNNSLPLCVAYSPLDNLIATGDYDGTIRVWAFSGTWIINE